MRYQVPQLAACPPGSFAPALGAYDAYGAPVVLHETESSMAGVAGGIFSSRSALAGFGDAAADLTALLAQGKTMADALAQLARGKDRPQNPQETPEQRAAREKVEAAAAAATDSIYGIPTPVAVAGVLAGAYLLLKKRSNPKRRRR